MDATIETASSINSPIAMAGLALALLFFVIKAVLSLDVFTKLTKNHTVDVINSILDRFTKIVLVAMLLGFIGYILSLVLEKYPSFTLDASEEIKNQVLIKSGRFEPLPTFFVESYEGNGNDFFETAMLNVKLVNVCEKDVLVTSVQVEVKNNTGILSTIESTAGIGPEIGRNKPLIIHMGEEVEFKYAGGFKFEGLVGLFDLYKLRNEHYFDDTTPKLATRLDLVNELNTKLSKLYPTGTRIDIKLYSNHKLIAKHVFDMSHGVSIADDKGQLQHSYFLGELIYWLNSPYSKDLFKT